MPIFEYKCDKCGKISEFLEGPGRQGLKICAHCGSKSLKRQFSVFNGGVKAGASKRCLGCAEVSCPHSSHHS